MKHPKTDELKQIYSPEGSPLREYQMGLLEILINIDKLCRENNINYSLAAGTLMGAFRHEGFIPWDDDADIMMTRAEFEKLKLLCDENGKINEYLGIKYDLRPTFTNDNKIIDIFVEDNCPDSKIKSFIKLTTARIIGVGIKCKLRVITKTIFKPFKHWCLLIPFVYLLDLQQMQRMIQKVSIWFNKTPSRYLSCYTDSVKDMGHKYSSELFDGYIDVLFEGYKFKAAKNYEIQLKELYGDWKQIPNENKRVWLARVKSDVKIKRK